VTDEQAIARWQFRHDFLEALIVTVFVCEGKFADREMARNWIRGQCEQAMKDAGFKYPLAETDE
jgi:hypothetical protein